MAKDEDTGIDARAHDGVPDDAKLQAEMDELAARRAQAKEGNGGRQIDEQPTPPVDEEDDGQLFVWEQGRKVTLGTLIARGTAVEHAFVFGGKRLKGAGALVAFDDDVLVITRGKVGKTSIVPTRDDDERVTKVVIETHIAAKVVAPADSAQGMDLLAGVFAKRGIKAA